MYLFVYLFTILYVFIIQVNTVTAYPFLQFNSFNFSKNVNWQPDHCDTGVHGVTNAWPPNEWQSYSKPTTDTQVPYYNQVFPMSESHSRCLHS